MSCCHQRKIVIRDTFYSDSQILTAGFGCRNAWTLQLISRQEEPRNRKSLQRVVLTPASAPKPLTMLYKNYFHIVLKQWNKALCGIKENYINRVMSRWTWAIYQGNKIYSPRNSNLRLIRNISYTVIIVQSFSAWIETARNAKVITYLVSRLKDA